MCQAAAGATVAATETGTCAVNAGGCLSNEFFPTVQRVAYDPLATDAFTYRYYNKSEVRPEMPPANT